MNFFFLFTKLGLNESSSSISNNNNNNNSGSNNSNNNTSASNTNSPQPHRARLVQIPNKLEDALLFNRSFDNNTPILSTSQLKFPRKSSLRSSSPPNNSPPPPPPPPPPLPAPPLSQHGTSIPISRSFIGSNSLPTTYIQTNNSDKSNDTNHSSLNLFSF